MPEKFSNSRRRKALLLVLDSVGCGHAPDAAAYGDTGANTLGHVLEAFPNLQIPALRELGLSAALALSANETVANSGATFGVMNEAAAGKDTTTGHWEMMGAILEKPFSTFNSFPLDLLDAIEREAGILFIGNLPASGTEILERLGDEHLRTGRPILYTSADSVLQIAAHEEIISVNRLYTICQIARKHADAYRIGRVIARPFTGASGHFQRTAQRHDFSFFPPRTLLNALDEARVPVIGVGKISDIFAASGVSKSHPTASNEEGMQLTQALWNALDHGLLFVNLVDFDMRYGHRRDVAGYAHALETFDRWLGQFLPDVTSEDLLILTADHGNDPTYPGTDHTRERVPLLVRDGLPARSLGIRSTYADVAASLAIYFDLSEWPTGRSFLAQP